MEVIDGATAQWGKRALHWARAGQRWRVCQGRRLPRYATRWDEVPVICT